ncbi:MAG: BUG/TctC family periplasmic protein [uncultured Microvirga sp.]|uniref:BUG/TctC family periplasmic protein n=1 Tax=uncultured Microvirga sp. TaxID=412392 RepID=A0A6J4KM87_9HYPH|nr:MAG: BUG/TctC family periplasmic protein [uncultured Microvirga sp.]
MLLNRRSFAAGAAAAALLPLTARRASAAAPVRLVVPFPPGGAVDQAGRLLAERLGPILDANVVVENVGGAGGMAGIGQVAKAAPDGTVLGLAPVATLVTNKYLYSKLPYDPDKDLKALSRVVTGTLLCVVGAERARERGWNSLADLVTWSKANPEKTFMGSSGIGQSSHLMLELLNKQAGVQIVHVPYRGGGPAITDLLGGRIDLMFDVIPALMPHVQAGAFVPLAVASADRIPQLPDVPSMKEQTALNLGNVDIQSWLAVVVPVATPDDIAARLHAAVVKAATDPEMKRRIEPAGYTVVTDPSITVLKEHIARENPVWEGIVRISGAKLD